MRLLVNINVIVSALFNRQSAPGLVMRHWRERHSEWLTCEQHLAELTMVLAMPHVSAKIDGTLGSAYQFVNEFHARSTMVSLQPTVNLFSVLSRGIHRGSRHCERSAAIHGPGSHGLPRCARSDELQINHLRLVQIHRALQPPFEALCRDVDDDYLLVLLTRHKADFLITGDKDLLALKAQFPNIISARELIDRL